MEHSLTHSGVHPVSRGGQFDDWTTGQMDPFGAREAKGGRRADHYTCYQGIEAKTLKGITILFDHAEVCFHMFVILLYMTRTWIQTSAVIMKTAEAVHPKLVTKLHEASTYCDRVGRAGVNLFDCYNYTAPQHGDNDCTHSLSAQLALQALQKWKEFAFCATQYGYYLVTRANMLWYVFHLAYSLLLLLLKGP